MTAAAIDAQVVDIQNDRLHKGFIKVTLHVAAERGRYLNDVLGTWPTYTDPVPVALARLAVGVSHSTPMDGGADQANAVHAPASDMSRPSTRLVTQAAIACTDSMFRMFLEKTYCNFLPESCGINTEEHAADMVRYICKVKSRKEILVGTPAATEWNKLYSRYIAWREVPELVS